MLRIGSKCTADQLKLQKSQKRPFAIKFSNKMKNKLYQDFIQKYIKRKLVSLKQIFDNYLNSLVFSESNSKISYIKKVIKKYLKRKLVSFKQIFLITYLNFFLHISFIVFI